MEILNQITEDEFISEFLKAELNSSRFSERILVVLKKDKQSKRIISHPDLLDKKENQYRKRVLKLARGYPNKRLFLNFPNDVKWYKAKIRKTELKKVKYIDYSYWNELSNNTRLPLDAAKSLKSDPDYFKSKKDYYFKVLEVIQEGKILPKMIFVSKTKRSRIVILEGHVRLTAYFLEQKNIPKSLEIIIGYSEGMDKWGLY